MVVLGLATSHHKENAGTFSPPYCLVFVGQDRQCWVPGPLLDFGKYQGRSFTSIQMFHTHTQSWSLNHWFTLYSFIFSFLQSLIPSFIHIMHSFVYSAIDSLTYSHHHGCVHSFIHLSIRWLVDSFISSILSSIHWNIVSLIHSFTPSFLHSLIHPFVHSLLHAFAHLFFHVSDFICFHVMSFACQKPCAHCITCAPRSLDHTLLLRFTDILSGHWFLIDIALLETSAPARPGTTGIFT
jgi:hypothetical protein